MRASAVTERAGFPSVSIVATGFVGLAGHVAKGLGMPSLAIAEYAGLPMTDCVDELERKVLDRLVPQIIAGLTQNVNEVVAHDDPEPADIVFEGTLAEVENHFYRMHWGDGLPIIPPTRASVEAMLRYTDRDAHELIGTLPPENRRATVWNIAVNGVMAGCLPEYMPVLIAVVEAIADPGFRLQDAGATPGWEPLVILSGPLATALDFNCGAGVMRAGRRANTTVGRFLKLVMRNIAGIRIPPGEGDKGSIGANFNVALTEDESVVRALGWPTFGEERGCAAEDSVVTVQSVTYSTPPIYSAGATAEEHLDQITDVFGQTCAFRAFIGVKNQSYCPLLVLGPGIARALAKDGLTKVDVRRYIYQHATMTAGAMERYARHGGHTTYSLKALVGEGAIPHDYCVSADPDRLVRVFVHPEMIGIVVAGDPDRNQSRGYVNNHIQGAPVSRRVALPSNWPEFCAGFSDGVV